MQTYLDVALILAAFAIAVRKPKLGDAWFRKASRWLGRVARRRWLAVTLVGLTSMVISAVVSLFVEMPQPAVHDEFSYLLAADTFAHGRLTNPTHPMWVHFESFHIIHQPTYQSKYPPAQGLMLAIGQVIGGHPILGAWLSTALACAAIGWMLLAWLPPRWAVLGGLLAVLHPTILGWSQCYWGGAVAMGGGALLLGAWRRMMHLPRLRYALLMGLGMAILANSRPYEGLGLSLLLLATLLARVARNGHAVRVSFGRILLPILSVLIPTAAALGFYNLRVTGCVFVMPYSIHEATYGIAPLFIWQSPRPEPIYHHKEMRDFMRWWLSYYQRQRSARGWASECAHKVQFLADGFFRLFTPTVYGLQQLPHKEWPIKPLQFTLAALLVVIPWLVRRDRWVRFALVILGLFVVVLLLETWTLVHYAAPVAGLLLMLLVQAMRYLCLLQWCGRPTGRFIVRAVLIIYVVSAVMACSKIPQICSGSWATQRARLLMRLKQEGGRHLIIVRYGPGHSAHVEWVYNGADIDHAPVIWAREMGVDRDRELLEYYSDRRVWLLEADENPPRLVPYLGLLDLTGNVRAAASLRQ